VVSGLAKSNEVPLDYCGGERDSVEARRSSGAVPVVGALENLSFLRDLETIYTLLHFRAEFSISSLT